MRAGELPPRANRIAGLFAPATVVLFAGCGGTCIGIEQAYADAGFADRYVDAAVNHWTTAVGVHELNHPMTQHLRADVREVDPDSVVRGREIALLHASPDCTHFSKARGSKPKKKEIRGLAWVVVDWARKRRPTVITLENVEEFRQWGPLGDDGQPCPRRRGDTYREWVAALEALGYAVDARELRACDYGAPTTRKRLFVVARNDGRAIVWPEKTHGQAVHQNVRTSDQHRDDLESLGNEDRCQPSSRHRCSRAGRQRGDTRARAVEQTDRVRCNPAAEAESGHDLCRERRQLKPFRTAAECIDWSIPMLSIFATPAEAKAFGQRHGVGAPRRPLKQKTLDRIAGGLVKWVLTAKRPFIVRIAHGDASDGGPRWGHATHDVEQPLGTVAASKDFAVVDATIAPYSVPNLGERAGQSPRSGSVERPLPTITAANTGARLVAASLSTLNHSGDEHRGADLRQPLATVTGSNDARALVAAMVTKHYTGVVGHEVDRPLDTITSTDHNALTVAYLSHQYGSATNGGQGNPEKPLKTITSGGHHAAVAATVAPFTIGAGGPAYAGKPKSVDAPFGTVMVDDRGEFAGKLPVRYSPNGGGSAQRFWSAVGGIETWHRVFGRCEFTTDDAFDVLEQTHDSPKVGIYSDAPWPDAGDGYAHAFTIDMQRRLAAKLATFREARVVVRFARHPLIEELYPRGKWTWLSYPSRGQDNGRFAEVLLLNGPSLAA